MKNKINNTDNKSFNSEAKIFNDIPMTKIRKNKYYDDEESINNKTVYRDESHEKYNNLSFNKSIEHKRKLLGIPLNKNGFQKMVYAIRNYNKDDKNNMEYKLSMYRKRQDEILKNYEKKNMINQKSRDIIKNKNNI